MNSTNQFIHISNDDFNSHTVFVASAAVKNGDKVEKEQIIAVVETSKKVLEVVSPYDGFIYFFYSEGEQFKVSDPLAVVSQKKLDQWSLPKAGDKDDNAGFTLKARKLAGKFNLEKEDFKGKNQIKEEDVITLLSSRGITIRNFESQIRLAEENLAPVTYVSSVTVSFDFARLQDFIAAETTRLKKNVNSDAVFIFAVHSILKKYEKLTSLLDDSQLITLGNCPVGIYISDEHKKGATYVVDGSECSSLEKTVDRLYDVYRNYLNNDIESTVQRCAFFISNMMTMNVSLLNPMLKSGTAATMGIASPDNGRFNVTLAFDHRLLDGGYAARFLNDLKNFIEQNQK